jgi:cytochrome bd-type quinol oxidase subunit 2
MQDILDSVEKRQQKTTTNYKKWAFLFFINYIIVQIIVAYKISTTIILFEGSEALEKTLIIMNFFGLLFLVIGSILTILSLLHEEERNYQYKTAIFGFGFCILLTVFQVALSFFL